MGQEDRARVLTVSDDLPVRTAGAVHSGKVRSVYFLTDTDSRRLVEARGYPVAPDARLALMVISDRLSAFDCLWHGESLAGVPGKGACLNAIAAHWFAAFDRSGVAGHHLLEMPHPMLWVVRRAEPIRIEAIARRYLTGSLWRAYARGERRVGGVTLPDGLARYARLPQLLFTPSTKGVVDDVPGVAPTDDAPLAPSLLREHHEAFGLRSAADIEACEAMLRRGFGVIEDALEGHGELLVDTKFEFGLAPDAHGRDEIVVMDEVGTPDSSRIWLRRDWEEGTPRERSKEQFREALLAWVGDAAMLLEPARMSERSAFAREHAVPDRFFEALATTYREQAELITGGPLRPCDRPREAMLSVLDAQLGLLS